MQFPKVNTGVWIDYQRAILVILDERGHHLRTVYSNAERKPRFEGETSNRQVRFGTGFDYESSQENKFGEDLKKYYRHVMKIIEDADFIYIFGPAEAKLGLQKEIEADKSFTPLVAGIETSEQMTENQLVAKVKNFFTAYLRSYASSGSH